jgi:hypothetical protein
MSNQASTPLSGSAGPSLDGRLDSWKEIAAYLRREVRTVQRWEKSSAACSSPADRQTGLCVRP